jgi:hypothetical protein
MSLAEVKKRYEAAREVRCTYERQWLLNLAFVLGEQWVTWDKSANTIRLTLPNRGKPRLVSNIIMPRIRLELAALTRLRPEFKVLCDSSAKARIIYHYLDYLWRTYRYEQAFKDALLWAITTGTGIVKTYYDPNAGPMYGTVRGGDPVVDVCSPVEIFVDPYARHLSEAGWVIQERVRSRDYVKQKYGKDVSSAPPTSMLSSIIGSLRNTVNTSRIPATTVCEYWESPSAATPDGYYLVYSGNTVLYEGSNPYADVCPIPFSAMVHTPVVGELYGSTWVSDARQVNVVYNRLRNDILENAVKLSNPPLLSPMGAIRGEVKMAPAEVITYNPLAMQGGKIDQVQITPFPAQAVNMLIRLEQEADELSAVTALTRGGVPRGVRSAEQFTAMAAMEDQRRQITLQSYSQMIEESQTYALQLARKFMNLPRLVGEGSTASFVLRGEDIPDSARVNINVNLNMERPDQQEEQRLFALFDRQIIQDPRLLVRLMKYGSEDEIFTDADLDEAQAERENTKMVQGIPVNPEDFHNHVIHLIEHNRFRKTEAYDNLSPDRKELFARHVAAHQQYMAQQQAVQQNGGEPSGRKQQQQQQQQQQA